MPNGGVDRITFDVFTGEAACERRRWLDVCYREVHPASAYAVAGVRHPAGQALCPDGGQAVA
jgi:hypothetical protein